MTEVAMENKFAKKELRIYGDKVERDTFYAGEWDNVGVSADGYLTVSLGEYVLAVYAPGCWQRYYIKDDRQPLPIAFWG